jgi:hypothetical protein
VVVEALKWAVVVEALKWAVAVEALKWAVAVEALKWAVAVAAVALEQQAVVVVANTTSRLRLSMLQHFVRQLHEFIRVLLGTVLPRLKSHREDASSTVTQFQ